ncbi:MAG: PAS domain S-box protein [Ktedonobacteraceae bacterium]|nr:PAS domain S-box protein [Ktedonobacteraceae bacterium]
MSLTTPTYREPAFRALIEHCTDAVTLMMTDGTIIYANPSTEQITGYPTAELVGKNSLALTHADDIQHITTNLFNLQAHPGTSISLEYRMQHKNGNWRWMEGTITNLLHNPLVNAFVCYCRDITERKQTEIHLRQNEEHYRVLVEQASDGIFLTDLPGHYIEVNSAGCKMSGYTREELLTRRIEDLAPDPDHEAIKVKEDGTATRSQWFMKRKDGGLLPIELTVNILSTGNMLGIARDISERLRAEEEREQLVRALQEEKEALYQAEQRKQAFVRMVTHELRTPLTGILGFLDLARLLAHQLPRGTSSESDTLLEKMEIMLRRAEEEADRETRLIEELLDVARMERQTFTLVPARHNLVTIIQEVVSAQQQATHTRRLILQPPPQAVVSVLVDRDRIGQVLNNYLTNALKYSSPDQKVVVGLEVERSTARVFVRDQGPGLTEQQQQQVWEQFYRADNSVPPGTDNAGLGLGLFIARLIVEQHQGQVGVQSRPGAGSTFWFSLPLTDEPSST